MLCLLWLIQVIEPVRSRCLCVRVGAPSVPEISEVLLAVAKKENLILPQDLAFRVANSSGQTLQGPLHHMFRTVLIKLQLQIKLQIKLQLRLLIKLQLR